MSVIDTPVRNISKYENENKLKQDRGSREDGDLTLSAVVEENKSLEPRPRDGNPHSPKQQLTKLLLP